jgi:AcrR family transcriptional regulator
VYSYSTDRSVGKIDMTREDILDAAAQVFRIKGFHGASMADIAEAVKLQKASLYHHVSSKQELLLALLDRALDMLTERISVISNLPLPADKKLQQMITSYLQSLAENPDLSSVLLFEHRSLDRKSHLRHVPYRDRFETLWREVISEGVRTKVFDCSDVNLAIRALMGTLNWTLTWYRPEGSKSIEQIADQYTELFFHGMLKN